MAGGSAKDRIDLGGRARTGFPVQTDVDHLSISVGFSIKRKVHQSKIILFTVYPTSRRPHVTVYTVVHNKPIILKEV